MLMIVLSFTRQPIFFQDLYRVLLEAESAGIMDDVDMTKVEELILNPEGEKSPS